MSEDTQKSMSFFDHLEELRKCLFKSILAVMVGFVLAYGFSELLYDILLIPFNEAYKSVLGKPPHLIFTNPFEPFFAYLKIAFVAGIFAASPYIFYELWKFIAPALYKNEKGLAIPFAILGFIFFTGGALFGYYFIFPIIYKFFISFSTETIQPAIKVSDYLKVSLGLILVFGIIFEVPLIVLFLVRLKVLSHKTLLSKWRYIIIAIAIVSAVLTPADPISMLLTMIPLYVFYALTTVIAYFIEKK